MRGTPSTIDSWRNRDNQDENSDHGDKEENDRQRQVAAEEPPETRLGPDVGIVEDGWW